MRFGNRFTSVLAAAIGVVAIQGYAVASESAHPHWSYGGEGGPAHWGELSKDYTACKEGKNQSPVDIAKAEESDLKDITFNYKASKATVLNNGHTIQVNVEDAGSINADGADYKLLQFHFHNPSEHTVGGASSPMELHLVHKNDKGELAVVGVMLNKGAAAGALDGVWAAMPKTEGNKPLEGSINPEALLPKARTYYTYPGSLTTPPCTEGVKWLVLKSAVEMSDEQLKAFNGLFPVNNRPVQPIGSRAIKSDVK